MTQPVKGICSEGHANNRYFQSNHNGYGFAVKTATNANASCVDTREHSQFRNVKALHTNEQETEANKHQIGFKGHLEHHTDYEGQTENIRKRCDSVCSADDCKEVAIVTEQISLQHF